MTSPGSVAALLLVPLWPFEKRCDASLAKRPLCRQFSTICFAVFSHCTSFKSIGADVRVGASGAIDVTEGGCALVTWLVVLCICVSGFANCSCLVSNRYVQRVNRRCSSNYGGRITTSKDR